MDRQYNSQKKDRQHNSQKKKDRQHNSQKKKDRQHNSQKKKDRQHNSQQTEEQTTHCPKEKKTKEQTTIHKTFALSTCVPVKDVTK
jgi:hypothetical protein